MLLVLQALYGGEEIKMFKEFIGIINRTIGCFCFGFAIPKLFIGDYRIASWNLLVVSILFIVGYYTERWSKF